MKKLIIIISLLFMTSCSAEYKLIIDKDMKVTESLSIKEIKGVLKVNNLDPNKYVEDKLKIYKEAGLELPNHNLIDESAYIGVKSESKYSSLSDLFSKSPIIKKYNAIFKEEKDGNNNKFTMVINSDFNQYFSASDKPLSIKNIDVTLDFPYKIISSNADKKILNKHTWSMDNPDNIKKLVIVYKKEKDNKTLSYVIIALVTLATIATVYVIDHIYKRRMS